MKVIVAVFLAFCISFAESSMAIQICNKSQKRALAAFIYASQEGIRVIGWLKLERGECSTPPLPGDIGTMYYYFANREDGVAWPATEDVGSQYACVTRQ